MLGIRTWGGRMEGGNESTELRRHPLYNIMLHAKDVDDTNHITLKLTGQ